MAKTMQVQQAKKSPGVGGKRGRLARETGEIVRFVNDTLKEAGFQHEFIADFLFERVFDGDVALALDADKNACERYRALKGQVGKSLELDATSLSRHIRIGALNHAVTDVRWRHLGWNHKVELLPLVKGPVDDWVVLCQGLKAATRVGMSVHRLREWVGENRPVGPARRSTVTMSAGHRLVATGVELSDERMRESLAARLNKVPAPQRSEFLRDLDVTIENLQALREAIDEE